MRQHSGALERKWNRQFTRPIFPAGAKNTVWERDYSRMVIVRRDIHGACCFVHAAVDQPAAPFLSRQIFVHLSMDLPHKSAMDTDLVASSLLL